MQKSLLFLKIFILFFFLSGCYHNLDKLNKIETTHLSYYDKYLAQGYIKFSHLQAERYDWSESEYFAAKAKKIIEGNQVLPEEVGSRKIKSNATAQLTKGREDLMKLIEYKDIDIFQKDLARVQLLFDCWLEQESQSLQNQKYCKYRFLKEISDIQLKKEEYERDTATEYVYDIFFDLNSYTVDSDTTVDKVAEDAELMENYRVYLEGYSDTTGTAIYNKKISKKRALSVRNKLIEKGIDKNKIYYNFFGEDDLIVHTSDNVLEKRNRRVVIRLKGEK